MKTLTAYEIDQAGRWERLLRLAEKKLSPGFIALSLLAFAAGTMFVLAAAIWFSEISPTFGWGVAAGLFAASLYALFLEQLLAHMRKRAKGE